MQMLDAVINLKDNFSDTLQAVEKNVGEFQRTYKRTGRDIQRTGRTISSAGSTLTKSLTVPLLGMGAGAVKVGMEFESSMSEVAATMGITVDEIQNGSKEFQLLEDTAKEMGRTTQFSASESAEALNYLALAGYEAEEATEMLPKILDLAAAGELDLAYASDMVTDSMDALGLSIGEADGFIDEMAKTAQSSNTDVEMLGEAILTVGANGKELAGGTTELNTAIGLLGNAGIKGAEAGTKLRNVIMAMNPTTDKAADAFKNLGVESYDADGNLRPINETLEDMSESMEGMSAKEKTSVMSDIFNKQDLAAASTLLASVTQSTEDLDYALSEMGISTKDLGVDLDDLVPMMEDFADEQEFVKYAMDEFGASTDEASAMYSGLMGVVGDESAWDDLESKIDSAEGTAKEMADTLMHNLRGKFIKIQSAVEGTGIKIYEILKPALNDAADFIQKVVDKINALTPEQTELIGKFVKLAIVIGPALLVLGKMTEKVGGAVTEFGFLAQRIGDVGFLKAFLTPGVKVALALAAIAAVAYLVYKNWDKIKPVIDRVIDAFKSFKESIQPIIDWLKDVMATAVELVVDEFKKLIRRIKDLKDTFSEWKEDAQPIIEWLEDVMAVVIELVVDELKRFVERVKDLKESFIEWKEDVQPIVEWIEDNLLLIIEDVKEKFDEWKEVMEPLQEKFQELKELFGEFKEALQPVLEALGATSEETDELNVSFGDLLAFVSGVFAGLFMATLQTIAEVVSTTVLTMIGYIEAIMTVFEGLLTFLTGVFTGDWEMAWEGVKTTFSGVVDVITTLWNGIIDLFMAPVKATIKVLDNNFPEKMESIRDAWQKTKEFLSNPIKGTVNAVKKGAGWVGNKLGIGNNYKGTDNWEGGPTWIHEKGGEIVDLPSGTRIYPHDESVQMALEQGRTESQTQNIVQRLIPFEMPDIPEKIQNVKQKIIPTDDRKPVTLSTNRKESVRPEEPKKNKKSSYKNISVAKLAETIVVREDADIDRIANKLVEKLEETALNTP